MLYVNKYRILVTQKTIVTDFETVCIDLEAEFITESVNDDYTYNNYLRFAIRRLVQKTLARSLKKTFADITSDWRSRSQAHFRTIQQFFVSLRFNYDFSKTVQRRSCRNRKDIFLKPSIYFLLSTAESESTSRSGNEYARDAEQDTRNEYDARTGKRTDGAHGSDAGYAGRTDDTADEPDEPRKHAAADESNGSQSDGTNGSWPNTSWTDATKYAGLYKATLLRRPNQFFSIHFSIQQSPVHPR